MKTFPSLPATGLSWLGLFFFELEGVEEIKGDEEGRDKG